MMITQWSRHEYNFMLLKSKDVTLELETGKTKCSQSVRQINNVTPRSISSYYCL